MLITGGAGCLGSNLIDHYLPAAHEILAVDNFATGKRGNLPEIAGLTVVEGSIADEAVIDGAFADFRPEVVIHSAASYKDPSGWRSDAETNIAGAIAVTRAAERHGARVLINLQTALVYGRPDQVPIPADHPMRPFTSYGISKAAGENYMMMADIPVISLRLANVTGPRLAIGPIPTFYKRLKAGQSCFCSETVRDFLDMSDFLELMDLAIAPGAPTGSYNVSTGEGRTIKNVFDAVASYLGLTDVGEAPIMPPGDDDVPAVVLDPTETTGAFGWTAKIGFEDTISRMLAWYDIHGVTDIYSHLAPARARGGARAT